MEVETETQAFYRWEVAGKPVAVHLDFGVVDRLLLEVMQGFGSVPRRGAEVGGLLLGSVTAGEPAVVHVRDFEPVFSEHARGPSYLLSANDEARLVAAIERRSNGAARPGLSIVGFFRSHTRDGLCLTEEDLAVFDRYFPNPAQVFLLVKPYAARASVGGFFFREDGRIRTEASYLEFPFRRRDLGGGVSAPMRGAEPEETLETEMPARRTTSLSLFGVGESLDPLPPIESPRPKRNVWIPLSFIFLLVGVVLGFQTALSLRPALDPAAARDPYLLSLAATKTNGEIQLRWDRQSPAVLKARGGRLVIADGDHEQTVEFDASQLQNGTVVYRYLSGKVDFRLEVFPVGRASVAESVEIYTGAAAASPAETRPRAER
jgi:hypothetical protein